MVQCYSRPKHEGASLAREEGERDDGLSSCKGMSSTSRWDIMRSEYNRMSSNAKMNN